MKQLLVLSFFFLFLFLNPLTAQDVMLDTEGKFVEVYFITEMYLIDVDNPKGMMSYKKEFRERLYVMVYQVKGEQWMIYSVNYWQSQEVFALANVNEIDSNLCVDEDQDHTGVYCYEGKIAVAEFKEEEAAFFIYEKLSSPQQQNDHEYARFTFHMLSGSSLQVIGRKYFSSKD